uniref:Cytochrome b n=1 Tax=Ecnomus latus TaxID=623472 RepID=A0A9E8RUQ4_9NEOP|nr:cytochrome b [Ecnomus latus]UZZ43904.1 cytochrome b [Ecnomus latus]
MNKFQSMMKTHPLLKMINNNIMFLPTPSNITFMWNFGSLLGICLMIQIITGIILSIHYSANIMYSFMMINHINWNVNNGWLYRIIHSNGASMYFICIYMHISRNIYYETFHNLMTWFSGIIILFASMATAFLGYVLPWGQMSYWGATVITNLLSSIPYIGNMITNWMWGGFSINNATLNRFFSFHFLLPFIIMGLIILHLIFLHYNKSSNPMNMKKNNDKIPFHPYYSWKDLMGFIIMIMMFFVFMMKYPFLLNDSDNFIETNPMITPPHIQPEWYFLFAYAILRSIPNKLGGVIALLMSILILFFMPFMNKKIIKGNSFFIMNKINFWMFSMNFLLLSWIGSMVVEYPYITMSQMMSMFYFLFFIIYMNMNSMWNKLI